MNIDTHSPLWIALGRTFLHVLSIGAVVGLAASIVRRAMRRSSPEARHAAALAAMLVLAASPFASFVFVYEPATTAPAVAAPAAGPIATTTAEPLADSGRPSPSWLKPREAPIPIVRSSWFDPWIAILPGFWIAGTTLLLARTAAGVVGVERLRRSARRHDLGPTAERCRALARSLGIARDVSIAACDRVVAPMLIGIVRPMVVLPAAALSGWDRDLVEMALLHELAHLRRLDNLTSLFQQFVEALLFFHPTTWWLSAWLRLERESCCDALVVARTGDRIGYARLLAALAESRPPALSASLNEHPITTRIRRILFMEDRPMPLKPTAPEALALAAAGLLAASLLLPARAEPPASKPPGSADLRRLAEVVAAQPPATPPARPGNGSHPPDERIMCLLEIAAAQVRSADGAGALETLRGAAIETPAAAADLGRDYRALYAVDHLIRAAAIRHDAGDVEGARDRFRRLVAFLGDPDPDRDGPMMRAVERWAARTATRVSAADADDSQVVLDVGPNDAKGEDGEPEADPMPTMGRLELLASLAEALAKRKEVEILHSLVGRGLALTDRADAPLAKALFQDVFGKLLVLAGDEAAGRELTAKARDAVAAMPAGDVKDGTALLLASTLAETDLDGALDQIRTAAPGRRNRALRRLLEHLGETAPGPWLDASGLKINIGDPYLAMKDPARARADLPKILAVARTVEDVKARARTLAVLARLQAQANDLAGALATAESMPDLRRADHPGPADGFYDAVKPATFALIARHRAQAGDAAGAEAALARSAELTNAVADEVERIVSGLVLADAYETAGRRDAAGAVLADVLPRAQAQPEPRRSRLLGAIAREQVKSSGVAEASKTVDMIRNETGVEKAAALSILAAHLRDMGDAEAARVAARQALVCLRPRASDPKPDSNFRGSVTRDGFMDYDIETPAGWLATWRATMEPSLRAIVGEPEVELAAMNPEQLRSQLAAQVAEAFRSGGLDAALKVAEAVEDPSSRASAIRSLAGQVAVESLRK